MGRSAEGPKGQRMNKANTFRSVSVWLSGLVAAFGMGQALARAGFRGPKALLRYYAFRMVLGVTLPVVFLLAVSFASSPEAPDFLSNALNGMPAIKVVQWLAILGAVGFFGPSYWLDARIKARKRAIEDAFPNMLDLLQVGVEAGLLLQEPGHLGHLIRDGPVASVQVVVDPLRTQRDARRAGRNQCAQEDERRHAPEGIRRRRPGAP